MAISKVGLTTGITGTLPVGSGGTGITSGTTDQFLKFTGTTTLASAADNAGSLVQIGSTVTASDSANVDFDNLSSDYNMYIIIGSQIRLATAGANFEINFGTDGSTYSANKTSAYFHQYNNEGDSDLGSGTQGSASHGNSGGNQEIMRGLNNNSSYGKAGQFRGYISGLGQGGNYASFDFFSSYFMNTNHAYGVRVNGQVQAAADCIRFIPSGGNIATGEFTLYGVNQ